MGILRVLVGRLIASGIATLASWALAHYGFAIGPDDQVKLTEAGTIVIIGIFTAIYSVVHRLIDHRVNPGDAASPALAEQQKVEHDNLTRTEI